MSNAGPMPADPAVGSQERSTACLALAELLAGQSSPAEALQVLEGMRDLGDPAWEAAHPQAATAITMQRAHLLRRLGREVGMHPADTARSVACRCVSQRAWLNGWAC